MQRAVLGWLQAGTIPPVLESSRWDQWQRLIARAPAACCRQCDDNIAPEQPVLRPPQTPHHRHGLLPARAEPKGLEHCRRARGVGREPREWLAAVSRRTGRAGTRRMAKTAVRGGGAPSWVRGRVASAPQPSEAVQATRTQREKPKWI
jgi:hypothetical protein